MKKILSILLFLVYSAASSGTVISVHYCMGDLASVSIGEQENGGCEFCGMDDEGCCHDFPQVIKIDNIALESQVLPVFCFQSSWAITPLDFSHNPFIKGADHSSVSFYPNNFIPLPRYLLHRNFRI